ncbi:MAG: DUF1295 domain-containing protein [Candidatus Pacebacteria bacterium]|jgi:steroid 5-alpha reductase family enzyme|nr:DUF1295 domain-containing protein [Candidatus Paceibacterota bacterium]MBT3511760.1 DUF1295 domain-containing protein [Candidatus Paceibacterota bacterium]MBT4005185.1 DUF1295 domain-containing protein [Candidatus Paceibacterota bacterium]MBT4359011.1 DUF1295 domain-containing protein [Candidatus Paceibacterota bacterium]MBT4681286.1 DUF1295 domain-containing protein [Candidatus Paceibacterota bacterium]
MNIFISTLLISFFIQILFFTFAATFKTDKLTDLAYGLTFIFISWWLLLTKSNLLSTQLILTISITLWGLRLATYLFIRILKIGKDNRFDSIRENFFSFFKFWTFQAVTIWVVMLPSIYALTSHKTISINYWTILGSIIFLTGLVIETSADWQKFKFKNNLANNSKWIETGLWKYSRYPNYFGEMMVWWGIFITTINWQSNLSWLTILGPMFITFILLFISGIPLLEKRYNKKYKNDLKYQSYKKCTSLLIPWFPRKS